MGKTQSEIEESVDVGQPLTELPSEQEKAPDDPPNPLPKKRSVVWIAFKTVKTKLSLTDEGATPVDWKCIFLVFVSLFGSSFNITYLFPFLPEMIKTFGYKEEDKGYYAGIIASSMFVGRTFGSYFWGWISDKKGRRPIVLATLFLIGVCSLAFGFTTNIYFAVITRMLAGLVNGTVGTAKTILYEISDNTNQAVGMSIISVAWGSGIIAGPAVGGYLANPCKLYPGVFSCDGFFNDFPYMLPSFIAFLICIGAFIIDLVWLPETLYKKKEEKIVTTEDPVDNIEDPDSPHSSPTRDIPFPLKHFPTHLQVDGPRQAVSCENLHVESEGATYLAGSRKEIRITRRGISISDVPDKRYDVQTTQSLKNLHQPTFHLDDKDTDETANNIVHRSAKLSETDSVEVTEKLLVKGINGCTPGDTESVHSSNGKKKGNRVLKFLKSWSVVQLISRYDVFLAVLLYSLFSFSVIGVEDIFAVWASTDVMLDGLGFEPSQIGTVLGTTSLPLLFLQLFVFPNLVRRLGIKKTLVICTVISMVLTQGMPCLHLLTEVPVTLWVLLLSCNTVMKLMTSCVFSSTGLLINNSVVPSLAGQVNGLAMTVTAITRSIAPLAGGVLFSWTVGYASEALGPPFDVSFVFVLFGMVYWIVAMVGVTIPARLNKQKK